MAEKIANKISSQNSNTDGLKFKVYTGVQFVFNNSRYAAVDISLIDSNMSSAKYLAIYNTGDATPLLANMNSSKTHIQATSLNNLTTTITTNVFAVY